MAYSHRSLIFGILLTALSSTSLIAQVPIGTITTFAGTGTAGYNGEGLPVGSQLNAPTGVAVDSAGNAYVADNQNHRIRKIAAETGTITTVAGTGEAGFSGDGGPASSAQLWAPFSVAVDASGNLYIVDRANARVRKVTIATGVITTVAGGGALFDDGVPATAARFLDVTGVAVDSSGNIYVSDINDNRVRKVTAATGLISTVAGNRSIGAAGDGGPATSAQLNTPAGVAVDSAGNVFIADTFNSRVRKVTAATGIISTIAGTGVPGYSGDNGPATAARLNNPLGVAVKAGNVYIADRGTERIHVVWSASGIITTAAGNGQQGYSGDGGPATSAALS